MAETPSDSGRGPGRRGGTTRAGSRLVTVAWLVVGVAGLEAQGTPEPGLLVLSDQARRVLALHYRPHPTELMGCLIGAITGDTVRVDRIAPADVDPVHSTPTHVVPKQTCEEAGWGQTVGAIHSHPAGERCWYLFPGTRVLTSDGQSFMRSPYTIDALLCGQRVVWINREMVERSLDVEPSREGAGREPGTAPARRS